MPLRVEGRSPSTLVYDAKLAANFDCNAFRDAVRSTLVVTAIVFTYYIHFDIVLLNFYVHPQRPLNDLNLPGQIPYFSVCFHDRTGSGHSSLTTDLLKNGDIVPPRNKLRAKEISTIAFV